jgi:hypothetical protein
VILECRSNLLLIQIYTNDKSFYSICWFEIFIGIINAMNQIDLNNKRGDARFILQIEAFAGISGIKEQVETVVEVVKTQA